MQSNIFAQIRKEQSDFYNNDINIVEGYNFNQYKTIKRIHLYTNSQFESSPYFLGREKVFYNIVNPPIEVAAKMIDLDVKNIKLKALNPGSYMKTFFLENELKVWLKKSKFGKILNQISYEVPTFGSVLLQKTKNGAKLIDLRRLVIDPTVESVKDSRFIQITHYLTPEELRKMPWDKKAIEEAIDKFKGSEAPPSYEDKNGVLTNQINSTPYIKVIERYGSVPMNWIEGGKKTQNVKSLFIVAEPFCYGVDKEGNSTGEENGLVLFKSEWTKDEYPFKDFHYTKTRGRWLGIGVVEKLFDVQMRFNELKNQQRIAMEIYATPIYQTQDRTIVNNILSDLRPGDILTTRSNITPVDTVNRTLQDYSMEERSYMGQVSSLTFATDVARGESLPASTPATNALIADTQTKSIFGFKRQNYDLFLQEFFNDMVMPQLIKDLTPEHIFRFAGSPEEILKLDDMVATRYANDLFVDKVINGKSVTMEEYQVDKQNAYKQLSALGYERWFKIKDSWYNDADYDFDFIITNEQTDPAVIAQNANAVLTAISQNQIDMNNPMIRGIFYKYAEAIGMNPSELEASRSIIQNTQTAGGAMLPPGSEQEAEVPQTRQMIGMQTPGQNMGGNVQ